MQLRPPTIHELLEDPAFKAMCKTNVVLPDNIARGNPWRLWAVTTDSRWRTKDYSTYRDAWAKAVTIIRDRDTYVDVSVTCRPTMFDLPPGFYNSYTAQWCGRCRRPTVFREYTAQHHALRLQPALTFDDPFRCYYCGIRRAAMPAYGVRGQ